MSAQVYEGFYRSMSSRAIAAAEPAAPVDVPKTESMVQKRKRRQHVDHRAREIAEQIRRFRALGDCDHD